MTHPFDEEAVESGAIAAWNEESIRAAGKPRSVLWSDISVKEQQKWLGISNAALSAAFKSATERFQSPFIPRGCHTELERQLAEAHEALKPIIAAHDRYKADCPHNERDPIYEAIENARALSGKGET